MSQPFPHASEILEPIERFRVVSRWLCLYAHTWQNFTPYSLYYEDEVNPVQHSMTAAEVFHVLATELEREGKS